MKVVIATDGSKASRRSCSKRRLDTGCQELEIKLVSVQMSLVTGMYDDLTYGMLIEGESVRTKQALDKCADILKEQGIASTSEQGLGHAGDEIVRLAQEWSADLIVIGAKGIQRSIASCLEVRVTSWLPTLLVACWSFDRTAARPSIGVAKARSSFRLTTVMQPVNRLVDFKHSFLGNAQVELFHVIERPALLDETIRYDPIWYEKIKAKMEEAKPLLGSTLASKTSIEVVEANYTSEKICNELTAKKIDLVHWRTWSIQY